MAFQAWKSATIDHLLAWFILYFCANRTLQQAVWHTIVHLSNHWYINSQIRTLYSESKSSRQVVIVTSINAKWRQYFNVIWPKHGDIIKWTHFPHYWPFVWGIHRSPMNSPQKGQWRGALMFSLICPWKNCWVNNREAGDLRRHRTHCDVIVMACHRYSSGFNEVCNVVSFRDKSGSVKKMFHKLTQIVLRYSLAGYGQKGYSETCL